MKNYLSELEQQILLFYQVGVTSKRAIGMSSYEVLNLCLTGIYDLLTFGLLFFVAYEALIKPRKPNVVLSLQSNPPDAEPTPGRARFLDLVIDNRGADITNVVIKSEPDSINWGKSSNSAGKSTSQYFHSVIPGISRNEKLTFFWCDGKSNLDVISKPIVITVEYDNPLLLWPPFRKKCCSNLIINLKVYENIYWGVNQKYDVHNVAEELNRLRKDMQKLLEK